MSVDFANNIINLCNNFLKSDNFADNFEDFIDICTTQIDNHEKIIYAGINATCSSINPIDENPESDVYCNFEIYDDENGEIDFISTYVPFERFRNMALIEGTSGILFVTDMYYGKDDGEIKYHLGGFLPVEQGE